MSIRIHRILAQTRVAGPGLRFCIWVQGCSRHCDGCMVPETWPFENGILMELQEVIDQIANKHNIEGITILGGEPFEQVEAVSKLASKVKQMGLSVVTFTGYMHEELQSDTKEYTKMLLENTDLLIAGPYRKEKFDLSRPWVGSSNQQYHFLTGRYSPQDLVDVKNQMEVRVSKDGQALINGMGDFDKIKNLL